MMDAASRIVAAVLIVIALVATISHANAICVESSGRTSYGCNDVVPDEMRVSFVVGVGFSSPTCGICHDYMVGQAVAQSFQDSALPVPAIGLHRVVPAKPLSTLRHKLETVALLDNSAGVSPLKC